jgi:hypothetical protein
MTGIRKKIPQFFLLLAGLISTAHMIIPHDHHIAGITPGSDEACPISKGNLETHRGFPIHCHAFNDLNAEEATTFYLPCNVQLSYNQLKYSPDPLMIELQVIFIRNFDVQRTIPNFYLAATSLLRAPPSLFI